MPRLPSINYPKISLAVVIAWCIYFIALFSRMLSIRPDGLYVGHEYLWSDWALHLGLVNIFAHKPPGLWFAYHPVFADGKMTYAFLTNLISGLLVRTGFGLPFSLLFPSILFSLVLVFAMNGLFARLLQSRRQAAAAICLFFFSAGLGFIDYFRDFLKSPDFSRIFLIDHPYGGLPDYQWYSGNWIAGLLLPQRAFLLGMPLALLALLGLFRFLGLPEQPKSPWAMLVCSGLCLGLLPITHMHSLIALTVILAPVMIVSYRRWRGLSFFVLPGAALAVAMYRVFLHGGIRAQGFMSWSPGLSTHGWVDWLGFWGRAWGLTIPLAIVGLILLWPRATRATRAFFCGCFVLFAVANVIQFQPTLWDNSKLFLWCYFGFAALVAHALSRIAKCGRTGQVGAGVLAIVLTLTGALEVVDLQRVDKHTYRLLSTDQIALAEDIRLHTDPLARFATAFNHDHPISIWAARPILLGYRSWAGNFGMDYGPIERDMTEIYKGTERTPALLLERRISYVYFGPAEEAEFHPNEAFFKTHYPLAFRSLSGEARVYDVRVSR